jgi:hypothetical protein
MVQQPIDGSNLLDGGLLGIQPAFGFDEPDNLFLTACGDAHHHPSGIHIISNNIMVFIKGEVQFVNGKDMFLTGVFLTEDVLQCHHTGSSGKRHVFRHIRKHAVIDLMREWRRQAVSVCIQDTLVE